MAEEARARKCTGSCAGQWSMSPSSTASTRASSPAAGPVAWSPDACGNATAARSRWRRAAARSSSTNASRTRANSAMTSKSLSPCARLGQASLQLGPAAGPGVGDRLERQRGGERRAEPVAPRQLGGAARHGEARLGVVADGERGRDLHVQHRHGRERSERQGQLTGLLEAVQTAAAQQVDGPELVQGSHAPHARPCPSAIS